MPPPIRFERGRVYRIRFHPPDNPTHAIDKFLLNLQEGKIVDNSPTIVGVVVTTQRVDRLYAADVYVSPQECSYPGGAKVMCNQIHTVPKADVVEAAYRLSSVTMDRVNQALLLGVGIAKLEDLELEARGIPPQQAEDELPFE